MPQQRYEQVFFERVDEMAPILETVTLFQFKLLNEVCQ
jgi:hypothetical protein